MSVSNYEKEKLREIAKGLSEEDAEILLEIIPPRLCLEKIRRDLARLESVEQAVKNLTDITNGGEL